MWKYQDTHTNYVRKHNQNLRYSKIFIMDFLTRAWKKIAKGYYLGIMKDTHVNYC